MRVLIVEDDPISAELLEAFLQELNYDVSVACDGRQAVEMLRRQEYRIVVSDWEMPEMTGPELCRCIRGRQLGEYVYVLLLTSRSGTANFVEGLRAGADDFITKPFHPDELRVRLRAAERILTLESRDLIIFSMARLAESRDPETGAHLERIREYCRILGGDLAETDRFRDQIDADYIRTLYLTSPLHDIGKVGIPDHILLKPGRLTKEEFEVMKQHVAIGGQTLDAAVAAHPQAEFLQLASAIAWCHHERFDGNGYPHQLAGEDIPLGARIVSVADVYDALTTKRVYKPAYSHQTARQQILEGSGTAFDPCIVEAFVRCEDEFLAVQRRYVDHPETDEPAPQQPIAEPTLP